MQVISYGGGVQSTALLVLAARRAIPAQHAIFIDLMEAENPATRWYFDNVAAPYARQHGIEMIRYYVNAIEDIRQNPAHPRPPFRAENRAPAARQCTTHWKVRPFRRALRALMRREGVKVGSNSVQVALGISVDEVARIKDSGVRYYRNVFPLVERNLNRLNCERIIMEEGLPTPDKSSCWFCPFSDRLRQQALMVRYPHLRDLAKDIQERINKARAEKGLIPLEVVSKSYFDFEVAECQGFCFT